jgi:tubulin polyglutamylase TTLL5
MNNDNDKNELQYVMGLLKNTSLKDPPKAKEVSKPIEISKELTFNLNNKWQFNLRPGTKFETFNNNGFINKKIINTIIPNEISPKIESSNEKENSAFTTIYQNKNQKIMSQKASTLFHNYKPNLNIRKFSNVVKTSNINRDNKWFNNSKINSMYKNSNYKNKKNQQQKSFQNKLIQKIKIRYLNFRPYIDLPKEKEEEDNKNIDLENCESVSIVSNCNPSNTNPVNYYFKLAGNGCLLVKKLLEDNGFIQSIRNEEWTITWSSGHIKLNNYEKLHKYQKMNHFPRSNELTRKDLLYKNLSKLKESFPGTKFDFLPESYILPNEYTFLKDKMDKNQNQYWIVKPVASSQGRGIFLTQDISEIPSNCPMIASRYISNPFLINKKKFDLRIYAFVTSIQPLRIYRFNEGLTRFSANNYNSDKNDRCAHLTNYAVNKNNKNYIQNNQPFDIDYNSSKWTLTSFKQYLEDHYIDSKLIFDKIDDIIIKTLISCENNLVSAISKYCAFQENCFELYGFDILIDDNLNCWLMEVNLSPNLHYDAPIDLKIKGEMIAEMFDLLRIVPYDIRNEIYENTSKYSSISKYLNYPELKDIKITNEIKQQIWDTEEENARIKQFKRIFPSINYPFYQKFFDQERIINYILYIIEAYKQGILNNNNYK